MDIRVEPIKNQIRKITEAMKEAGVWKDTVPDWIYQYTEGQGPDFWEWMQFIHLPMRLTRPTDRVSYLAPKLKTYIADSPAFTPLLQLTIELDAMSPAR